MSGSNPRRGDWNNNLKGIYVYVVLVIISLLLIVLTATGHILAAFVLFLATVAAWTFIATTHAAHHERDH